MLGRVKLVFLPFAGAIFSFPAVCHPVATQAFVSLSEDREGRMSFGCDVSLIPSQAFSAATTLAPWGKCNESNRNAVNQFSQLFPVFQLSSSPR